MATTNADFKVKKGLLIEGGNLHYSSSQNATASVDASSADDTVGKTLTLTSGLGTGDAIGGSLLLRGGGPAGISGSTPTTPVTAITINSAGNTTVDNNLTVTGNATVSGATLDVNATTTITGDSVNQQVALIQTSDGLSSSGDVFRVQRHSGSAYDDALRVSAKTGNVGIKGAPDTTTTASAKALKVTGNVDFTGSMGTAHNDVGVTNIWAGGNLSSAGYLNLLPATVTPATGEIIGAFGKLRDSTGFANIANTAQKNHSIVDFEKESGGFTNFYTSDAISESLTSPSDDKAAGNFNWLMKINLTQGNSNGYEVFGAAEVFAVMQILDNASPQPNLIAYRVEKLTGFASTSTVTQESQVLDESVTSYGHFNLGFQSNGLEESNTDYGTMNLIWRWTQPFAITGSTDYTVKWAFNVNGVSLDPGQEG